MKMTFIVLSKSAKHGNKCVAGIRQDGNFVRIVSPYSNIDNAIPNWYIKNKYLGLDVQILDEIEVEVIKPLPNETQPENYLVDLDVPPSFVKKNTLQNALDLTKENADSYAFINTNRFLNVQEVANVGYSLKFIIATNVHIEQVDSYGKPKMKVWFTYNGQNYERFSLTDPDYFCDDEWNFTNAALFLSLAHQPFVTDTGEQRYYKFVAKVFPLV